MNICLDKISNSLINWITILVFVCIGISTQGQSNSQLKEMAKKKGNALREEKEELKRQAELKAKYAFVDSYALAIPEHLTYDVKLLASYLSVAPPLITREEKLRAIYTWVTNNIKFDWYVWAYENQLSLKSMPDTLRSVLRWKTFKMKVKDDKYNKYTSNENILKLRRASDKGLAQLFNTLCFEAGLKSLQIEGYVKDEMWLKGDPIYRINHKYNAIYLTDQWFFLDVLNKFWISDQEKMKKKMIPAEPMWQLTNKPISMDGFIFDKEDYYSTNYNYKDTIKSLRRLNPHKKKIARAQMVYRFNPDNNFHIGYAYLDVSRELYYVAKNPKTSLQKAQEGFTLASKNYKIASSYLKEIKKNELKPASKTIINRNKTMHKEKAGEFKVKIKELEADVKAGPPESTLEDDLAEVKADFDEKISVLKDQLLDEAAEVGEKSAMGKLIARKYDRLMDSTQKAYKREVIDLEFDEKTRLKNYDRKLKMRRDSIMEAEDKEDERFNRVRKTTKKKLKNDLKKNSKDIFYAKDMSKKAKGEAKKMKTAIKTRQKEEKAEAKKQAAREKEEAKKAAAKEKAKKK